MHRIVALFIYIFCVLASVVGATPAKTAFTLSPQRFCQLPDTTILCTYQDSEGYRWYGTPKGLCRDDGYSLLTYRNEDAPEANRILCLAEDSARHILVGTPVGAYYVERSTGVLKPVAGKSLSGMSVQRLLVRASGQLIVTTDQAVYLAASVAPTALVGRTLVEGVPDGRIEVSSMLEDKGTGHLLCAIRHRGLYYFGAADNTWHPFPFVEDLCQIEDIKRGEGCLWLTLSDQRLLQMEWPMFTPSPVLTECGDSLQRIFVASMDEAAPSTFVPHLVSVEIDGQEVAASQVIELACDASQISLSFSTFDYQHTSSIRFSSCLEGVDDGWTNLPVGQNTVAYTTVPSGQHSLKIRATSADGQWLSRELTLTIVRAPYWWQTGLAFTLYIIIGVALLVAILIVVRCRK